METCIAFRIVNAFSALIILTSIDGPTAAFWLLLAFLLTSVENKRRWSKQTFDQPIDSLLALDLITLGFCFVIMDNKTTSQLEKFCFGEKCMHSIF